MLRNQNKPVAFGGKASVEPAEIVGNAGSQLALPANPSRTHATISNLASSTTAVWLGFGVCAAANRGMRLDPGAVLQIDADWYWTGSVCFYGAATATVAIWEA
jgi:hypothetical protein